MEIRQDTQYTRQCTPFQDDDYNGNNNNNNNNYYYYYYKYLKIEIQRMWKVKRKVIPAIIGATGTTSKSLRQYLSNITGKQKLRNYKKRPHWALHTHYGKSKCKSSKHISWAK
jgi:hypothetical protein